MRLFRKCGWFIPALAVALLVGCGSAAPSTPSPVPDQTLPNTTEPPALVVKNEESGSTPDFSEAQPNTSGDDLLIMSSEEETGFALFCSLLSETQFRDMLQRDGANFIPDRLACLEDRLFAYYNSEQSDLVVCDSALQWFCTVSLGSSPEIRVLDAQWLDDNCLLILSGGEAQQLLYTYRPQEENLECVYTPPEDKVILGMTVTQDGVVDCTLADRAFYSVQSLQEPPAEPSGEAEAPSIEPTEETATAEPPQETVRVPVSAN